MNFIVVVLDSHLITLDFFDIDGILIVDSFNGVAINSLHLDNLFHLLERILIVDSFNSTAIK